jgi:hypothetical protein
MPEVIHQNENGKWYWWDESWTVEMGPFDTKELAQEACNRYAKEILHHPEVPIPAPNTAGEPSETPDAIVLLVNEPWSKLSDLEVDQAMEKCCFHELKGVVGPIKPIDWCRYLHNKCMVGNQAALPKERGYIADVCLRGY